MTIRSKLIQVFVELGRHLPYSIFGVTAGMVMMGVLTFLAHVTGGSRELVPASAELFHIFHPAHVLFSAVATTAMFWKHDNHNWLKAIVIGLMVGALIRLSVATIAVASLCFGAFHVSHSCCHVVFPEAFGVLLFFFGMVGSSHVALAVRERLTRRVAEGA